MTLNDLERRNSPFCVFLPNSIALQTDYVTVIEDRPIMSAECRLPVPVFHSSTLHRGLSAIAELYLQVFPICCSISIVVEIRAQMSHFLTPPCKIDERDEPPRRLFTVCVSKQESTAVKHKSSQLLSGCLTSAERRLKIRFISCRSRSICHNSH